MVYAKYFLPALALAGLAVGQNSKCGKQTIKDQGEASGLSSCSTIDGDLTIGNKFDGNLNLDGVEHIKGSFICKAESIKSISASSLEKIDDAFRLEGLVELANLEMDSLTKVGSIEFIALPKLQSLQFGKGVSEAPTVRIENTDLNNLEGIDLKSTEGMQIVNNPHLTRVNVNQITKASGHIGFSANHEDLKVQFPNLQQAQNMTFRNTSVVELPSLNRTDGLLGFYSNYFEKLVAPNLTHTGDLVFADNSNLNNISLPVLETIKGAFQVANNTDLDSFSGTPKLTEIQGALDFTGNFSEIKFPQLKEIRGRVNIQSSGDLECGDGLNKLESATNSKFTCTGQVDDPESLDPTDTTGGGSGGNQDDDEDAAGRLGQPPMIVAMLAFLVGAVQFAL